MTFLEKAMEIDKEKLYTGRDEDYYLTHRCPYEYGLCDSKRCEVTDLNVCKECWNREMPTTKAEETQTQASEEDKPFTLEEIGYDRGLREAWELAKKIADVRRVDEIFGTYDMSEILSLNTPQEALAKLKAYEEQSKIEVGDIVTNDREQIKGLVLDFDNADPCVWVLTENECVEEWDFCDIKKMEKHVDLEPIMKFVREK